jgi:hypothetical protein
MGNAMTFAAVIAAGAVGMPALAMLAPKAKAASAVRLTENDWYLLHSNLSFYLPCHLCHLKRIKNVHARESPGNANHVAYVATALILLNVFCQLRVVSFVPIRLGVVRPRKPQTEKATLTVLPTLVEATLL